jgi:hypothetical protein
MVGNISTQVSPIRRGGTSSADRPNVLRSSPDLFLLRDDDRVTVVEVKSAGATSVREPPAVPVPRVKPHSEPSRLGFILLQKWDGVVLQADKDTFTAQLFDSQGKLPPHDAVFARSELPPSEERLVQSGAPFVWTLGYRQIGSTRERASVIYFRRLPGWTEEEISKADVAARRLGDSLEWK